jgi:hypothetical protein
MVKNSDELVDFFNQKTTSKKGWRVQSVGSVLGVPIITTRALSNSEWVIAYPEVVERYSEMDWILDGRRSCICGAPRAHMFSKMMRTGLYYTCASCRRTTGPFVDNNEE